MGRLIPKTTVFLSVFLFLPVTVRGHATLYHRLVHDPVLLVKTIGGTAAIAGVILFLEWLRKHREKIKTRNRE